MCRFGDLLKGESVCVYEGVGNHRCICTFSDLVKGDTIYICDGVATIDLVEGDGAKSCSGESIESHYGCICIANLL